MNSAIKGQLYKRIIGKLLFHGNFPIFSLKNSMVKKIGSHIMVQ